MTRSPISPERIAAARAYGGERQLPLSEQMIGLAERGRLDSPNAYRGRYAVLAAILLGEVRPRPSLDELLTVTPVEEGAEDGR